MSKKDNSKVYSDADMQQEVEVSLDLPEEAVLAGLYLFSPYFKDMIWGVDHFYYPVDLEAEESMLAPIVNIDVFREFVEQAVPYCEKEDIPLAALLHIEGDEDDEETMVSLADGKIQFEIVKYFRNTVAIMNPDLALDDDFDDVFEQLLDEVCDNGYLDKTLDIVMEFASDPEFLEGVLFPEEE